MSQNDSFIRNVFNAMIAVKPKLSLFLADDDDSEEPDIRKLANEIVANYPWPIGIELRRLLSAATAKSDRGRLDQIFRTIERTLQFVSFVLVSQLLEEVIEKSTPVPDSFKNEFPRRFSTLTMGNFAWMVRSVGNIFTTQQIKPFIPGMEEILSDKFYAKLDFWTPERNEIGHYQITLSEEEIEVRCAEYQQKLEEIISALSFLITCPLVTITEIQVKKPKRQPPQYGHTMLMLNSASSDFSGKKKDYSLFTDSHSVLIVNSLKDPASNYLSLSPLVIDTHFETIDSREKLKKIKKDIYLYTKWNKDNRHIHYVGTEAEEKVDMRIVSFYDQLVVEFQEIMEVFSP